ncbi:MAG: macrolide family glycosyltransferase [Anaerolineae bacterium]
MGHGLFINLPATGHVNPTLAVVRELITRGERITYYTAEAFREVVTQTGADFRAYQRLALGDEARLATNFVRLAAKLIEAGEPLIAEILEDGHQPDYVITDSMTVWGICVARILDVPTVASSAVFVFSSAVARSRPRFLVQSVGMMVPALPDVFAFQRAAARIRERYGIEPPGLMDTFTADAPLNIVYTSRGFQPNGEQFPEHYTYVGPSIGERPGGEELPDLSGERVVYISLGTIFNERADFFRMCFEAFGGTDLQVVMAVGTRLDIGSLGAVPENIVVRGYVPQLDLLPHVDAFITHGGMNSVHEGLWFGVPLLVIPQMLEQWLVGQRVVETGAGLLLENEAVTAAALRKAVRHLLDEPAFREHAGRLGESFRAAGGYRRAADAILEYVT